MLAATRARTSTRCSSSSTRTLAETARTTARDLGLDRVEVRTADAGTTDSYAGAGPADVLLACGVFGNVTDDDVAVTVARMPSLMAAGGHVIWTRGCRVPEDPTGFDGDPSEYVRGLLRIVGFEEVAFVRPDDAGFRVGVHRWPGPAVEFRARRPDVHVRVTARRPQG